MSRFVKKVSHTIGLPPGSLVYVGAQHKDKPRVSMICYYENAFLEQEVRVLEECFASKDPSEIVWINIDGLQDTDLISKVGDHFKIHHLVLEDIANTLQRPKFEEFDDHVFIVLKMLYFDEQDNEIKAEQVSVIFGLNYVVSFQERIGDVFNPIRERIRNSKGRVRKAGADYLAYALMDSIVDYYFVILEKIGEKIEHIEGDLVAHPTSENLQIIQNLKRDMIFLRKSVWPLREIISGLQRNESALIQKTTQAYLRDLYDHTIQVIDTVESMRDIVSGMIDIYMSSISNRMNEVMKVLTIIATIFIPLTFIAGIYGMNFDPQASPYNMPELGWPFGYLFAWAIMIVIATGMVIYFKKKKWL